MKFAVVCDKLIPSGGLIRFENVGACLRKFGHELVFVPFQPDQTPQFPTNNGIMPYGDAKNENWDCVIVPGAGFSRTTVEKFSELRAKNFGVRVQMILNDQTKREQFLSVNNSVNPDFVIFNNDQWPIGSFRNFRGKQFHELIGAVDCKMFRPADKQSKKEKFIIGAQLHKNPEPLVDAIQSLPDDYVIRFFGARYEQYLSKFSNLISQGRIEWVGPLFGNDLANYYHGLDVMVSTERFAGWANVVAEAMASGIPVITSPAGTGKMALDAVTAHVMDTADPQLIVEFIRKIASDREGSTAMIQAARRHITKFDWSDYSAKLVQLIKDYNGETHYIAAPELGLFGKTDVSERLEGLEILLEDAADKTILDLGAAEGLIAKAFSDNGAKTIHAYEIHQSRVDVAKTYLDQEIVDFNRANLSDLSQVETIEARSPKEGYDLVLYLGIHHHILESVRMEVFSRVIKLTANRIAIRTPVNFFEVDRIDEFLKESGFDLLYNNIPDETAFSGPLWIYERRRKI